MKHSPDTPDDKAVPGHTRLFRREGGTYYLRAKVPLPLRPFVKRVEIRKSLDTKILKEALPKVKVESLRVDRIFAEAEAKLKNSKPAPARLSRDELVWIVSDWFVKQEAKEEKWTDEVLPIFDARRVEIELDDLKIQNSDWSENSPVPAYDPAVEVDAFLQGDGASLKIKQSSEDYNTLVSLFRRARWEITNRSIDRIDGRLVQTRDPKFAQLHSHSLLPESAPLVTANDIVWKYRRNTRIDNQSVMNGEVEGWGVLTMQLIDCQVIHQHDTFVKI